MRKSTPSAFSKSGFLTGKGRVWECHTSAINNIQITKTFRGLQNKPHKSRSHRELVWLVGCLMSRDKPLQNWALWSAGTEAGSSTIAQNNHQQHSAGFLGLRPDHQLSEETPQRPTYTRKKVFLCSGGLSKNENIICQTNTARQRKVFLFKPFGRRSEVGQRKGG